MRKEEIFHILKNEVNRNKISASYLFYGDKRIDLLDYALEFSTMVMTKNIKNEKEYKKIRKNIFEFQNPDIEIINKDNVNITINEVREIIYKAIETSYNSQKKIFILSGIENLRKESANALLKIVEEPPKNVYFILLSRSLNIISTIKSRTIIFHIESETKEELDVSRELYYFFDGNVKAIEQYKFQNIDINIIEENITSIDVALNNLIEFKEKNINKNVEIKEIIKYNKSIEYIAKKIKFLDVRDIYIIINKIETELKLEKEMLSDLMGKILLHNKLYLDVENFKKLIKIKNSIKNNVNVRSILFNFFNNLQNL